MIRSSLNLLFLMRPSPSKADTQFKRGTLRGSGDVGLLSALNFLGLLAEFPHFPGGHPRLLVLFRNC